jgi:hypothetical protein
MLRGSSARFGNGARDWWGWASLSRKNLIDT